MFLSRLSYILEQHFESVKTSPEGEDWSFQKES